MFPNFLLLGIFLKLLYWYKQYYLKNNFKYNFQCIIDVEKSILRYFNV